MNNLDLAATDAVTVEIGGMPIALGTRDASFRTLLEERYTGFLSSSSPQFRLDIDLTEPSDTPDPDEDVQVQMQAGAWTLKRGDFRALWDPRAGAGQIRQARSPYAVDSVLRIVHTLLLAQQGGFLIHAASAIRDGRAFLFAGVSGAGKTTISRLAPPDATLLTDEISYVRPEAGGYIACGTPFAGELARLGENTSAPLSTLFLLEKGSENRITPVNPGDAICSLLRNILFFANDSDLVKRVFRSACRFIESVPVRRLTFVPDERVWEIISKE